MLKRWDPQAADFHGGFFRQNDKDCSITAHCGFHGAQSCRRNRKYLSGKRPGQGRPVGHLSAWLLAGRGITREEHLTLQLGLAERVHGRALLSQDAAMESLLALEADLGVDEPPEVS